MSALPLYICVPAWTKMYVELAANYTIPAAIASLKARKVQGPVKFLLHTDNLAYRLSEACEDYDKEVFQVRVRPGHRDHHWVAFKQAHRDAHAYTPEGSICVLLNSDIVSSKETFSVVHDVFSDPRINVMVSVGIRALVDPKFPKNIPPIGVSAAELNRWIWDHKHPLTEHCVWGTGTSQHPTVLYFQDGENVSLHGWHLTPMFIRKTRPISFKGTIDDDLLQSYRNEEIFYVKNMECSFAELSGLWKTHPYGRPLTVESVLRFDKMRGTRGFSPAHNRNFRQRITVLGNPTKNDPNADEIIRRLGHR